MLTHLGAIGTSRNDPTVSHEAISSCGWINYRARARAVAEPVSLNTIRNWKNADDSALGSLRKLRDVCLMLGVYKQTQFIYFQF